MSHENKLTEKQLSLYLGVKCNNPNYILESVSISGICLLSCDSRMHGALPSTVNCNLEAIRPILRPLSDISDKEAIHIAKLCLNIREEKDFIRAEVVRDIGTEINIKVSYTDNIVDGISEDVVTIEDDFDIYHSENFFCAHNQTQIFQYLIQCQFDIFNWIGDGTALDKTKINIHGKT